jgi:hypothetical protein
LGQRRRRSSAKKLLCHTLPGPPWSWLPGITSTGTPMAPMPAHTALTSLLLGVGASNRSPATTTRSIGRLRQSSARRWMQSSRT